MDNKSRTLIKPCLAILFVCMVFLTLLSCSSKKMSVEEAKQVAVLLSEKTYAPPPRRLNSILAVLDQPGAFDQEAKKKLEAKADALPPETDDPETLARFYLSRGRQARELDRSKQALEDFRMALQLSKTENGQMFPGFKTKLYATILGQLGNSEALFGNFQKAINLEKKALEITPRPQSYKLLTKYMLKTGDFQKAEEFLTEGIRFCDMLLAKPRLPEEIKKRIEIHKLEMESDFLWAQGKFKNAESLIRALLDKMVPQMKDEQPGAFFKMRYRLAKILFKQKRFLEAEVEVREILKESIGLSGRDSATNAKVFVLFGKLMLAQGRIMDAENLCERTLAMYERLGISPDSPEFGGALILKGQVDLASKNYSRAMETFDQVKAGLMDNPFFYDRQITRNPDILFALIRNGRTREALENIERALPLSITYLGKKRYRTKELIAFRAVARMFEGDLEGAEKDFADAIPRMIENSGKEVHFTKNNRFRFILETYLDFLAKLYKNKTGETEKAVIRVEMFSICQELQKSAVQAAVNANTARFAAADVDKDLKVLVRNEQDVQTRILALQEVLSDALSAPPAEQNAQAIAALQQEFDTLTAAHETLLDEIGKGFPRYSEFVDPRSILVSEVQAQLKPSEALIAIYPTATSTYVWALPKKGEEALVVVPRTEEELAGQVTRLRWALDASPATLGDIPEFNFKVAYNLYANLIKPVESVIGNAEDLIIVAHGPLGQIPFSILPTKQFVLQKETILFDGYTRAPWFIKQTSIARMPTVSTFISLRSHREKDGGRKPFIGFGDPVFNAAQLTREDTDEIVSSSGRKVHVRGIRLSEKGKLDGQEADSLTLEQLNRLPDTAVEIKSIAKAVGAKENDIFLGKNASEKRVKKMDLDNRKIIAFATHALVPGDLDGLTQPAIALSSPKITGDAEDGLLTVNEILGLDLNADWVVLSACNTGAAEGEGAEAVSGLGRAFFYAGTKAVLVSMWPVETASARQITTKLFEYQRHDEILSRAGALRKSILSLIEGEGIRHPTGMIVAKYGHPFFWAPFAIYGEGGS